MIKAFGKIFSILFTLAMVGIIVGGLALMLIFDHYSRGLPDYSQLEKYDPPIVTRLYAADGKLLAEYATEKRVYVPLTAMPKRVTQAFISAEDKNFYTHPGVDFRGLMRAVFQNIKNHLSHSRNLVGGSTITQQVVKNFLLTNEQSLERKIREAILAFRISKAFSKDRILELYLNEIYLGQGTYGVAAASLDYFNKPLDELTIEEAAFLASLPKAPANYNPVRFYDRAKERRDWVINRMLEDGYITAEEAAQAKTQPILLRKRDETEATRADYFAEEVRRQLASMYGSDVLYKGGLWVKTTLDPALQKAADAAMRGALVEYDRRHGYRGPVARIEAMSDWQKTLGAMPKDKVPMYDDQALAVVLKVAAESAQVGFADGATGSIPLSDLTWARREVRHLEMGPEVKKVGDVLAEGDVIIVSAVPEKKTQFSLQQVPGVNGAMVVMDPHTGRVLAMSGGYGQGGNQFNRATQAKRQPGSAFKPFVYLTALESGFSPTTIIMDEPVELSQGTGLPNWKPKNYGGDFLGPQPMRIGLEKSRNAMTVRLAQMVGIDRVIEVVRRFGIYDDLPRNFSIVLGAAETTLLRMTTAYSILANGGKQVTPSLIERIDDRYGVPIFRRDMRECTNCLAPAGQPAVDPTPPLPADTREQLLDPRVDYQIVSFMQGVVERGTATRAKVLGKPLAGKTGTTNESRDTWFIGFTPNLVAGVYIGYDSPKSLGVKETGSSVALPAFIKFMEVALKDKPSVPFRIPPGIQLVKIDLNTGQPPVVDGGKTIYEAFVTGEPIFIPGREVKKEEETEEKSPTKEDTTENNWRDSGFAAPAPDGSFRPPVPKRDGYYISPPPRQPKPFEPIEGDVPPSEDSGPVGTGRIY